MTHRLHKGRPKTADISTRAVLEAVEAYARDAERGVYIRPFECLMLLFGCAEKVADNAVHREIYRGLLDCGVSVALPWLTPQGKHWLEVDRAPPAPPEDRNGQLA